MKQVIGFTIIVRTKSTGVFVEGVRPISVWAEKFDYACRILWIALYHENRAATLDCGHHTTQHLKFKPFHVDFHEIRSERHVVDRDDRNHRFDESQTPR